jgi:hypothetical protein
VHPPKRERMLPSDCHRLTPNEAHATQHGDAMKIDR